MQEISPTQENEITEAATMPPTPPVGLKEYIVAVIIDANRRKPMAYTVDDNYKTAMYKDKEGNWQAIDPLNSCWKRYFKVYAKNSYWALKLAIAAWEDGRG